MEDAVLTKKGKKGREPAVAAKEAGTRKMIPSLRWVVQGVYTLFYVLVGIEFIYFYAGIMAGNLTAYRPPAVEGFLPISSLLGLRYFLATGTYDHVHPAGLTIIMAVIVSAIATRKSFCGWVCPVGCISRMVERGSRRFLKKRITVPPILDHLLMSVKYLLCAFFVYVIFFKMSVKDIESFISSPYNVAADAKMLLFFVDMSKTTAITLAVIFALSVFVKNFWCRYLCPYGAFLGVISLFSPLAVRRDARLCIDCESCTKECPYQIRVHRKKSVRTVECTACLNCVSSCPVDDCLTVGYFGKKRVKELAVPLLLLAVILSFYLGARVTGHWESGVDNHTFQRFYSIAEKLDHPR
ncbi:MAG: 4Fe-4S binding protein [Deltaproteobacteria bacterium]|nr:4Fe-4S binding protein [Deltaproteobacteria bacterium]NIS78429.1 4Fe-4S binding protein [Deltaproteobacteria bacterium]